MDDSKKVLDLLNTGLLSVEQVKKLIYGESMSQPTNFGVSGTIHYYAQGDETRCPHCYENKLQKIGILTLSNNTQQDTHRCTGCGKLSSVVGGGIQGLVNEAAQSISGQAGFVSVSSTNGALQTAINNQANNHAQGSNYQYGGTLGGAGLGGYQQAISLDNSTNSKFDTMNSNLVNISSNMW